MVKTWLRQCTAWATAVVLMLWRLTCRRHIIDDPRPALRRVKQPYIYAMLHAHQLAAVVINDEPDLAAMVSRSADGDMLIPALRIRGIHPIRGSNRRQNVDKGGQQALAELTAWVGAGKPALLAVDGPRGPRNKVHRGVIALARQTGAYILPVLAVASRRLILRRTWDRLQIPLPGCQVRLCFGKPIGLGRNDDVAVRQQLAAALQRLEARYDAQEAG